MNILIIEDEYALVDAIKCSLEELNYKVNYKLDGKEGLEEALNNYYDLIILDIMLPNIDGFTILKELRNNNVDSKIIILSAKYLLDDKLKGLENGADDYMTKPFSIKELIARVNIQLNKTKKIIKYKDIELNLSNNILRCNTSMEEIELVNKEFKLLELLINNKNQILSKDLIYNKIWGIDNEIESNNLEVYISFLRRKLKAIDSNTTIKSIRGLGYRLSYEE